MELEGSRGHMDGPRKVTMSSERAGFFWFPFSESAAYHAGVSKKGEDGFRNGTWLRRMEPM